MAGKQAKTISDRELRQILDDVKKSRYPLRNEVMVLLSTKAGLRAKEISCVKWSMLTNASGEIVDALQLPNSASKGKSGRTIPLNKQLKTALARLYATHTPNCPPYIIKSQYGHKMTPGGVCQWFSDMYARLRLEGCSSHSGRRTFGTKAASLITTVGGHIKDVQKLMGHSSLSMTALYLEPNPTAQRKLVDII